MTQKEDISEFDTDRVNFARRLLILSSVAISMSTSLLSLLLVFTLGSDPNEIAPVLVLSLLFLIVPLILRVGLSYDLARTVFFVTGLGSIGVIALSPEGGLSMGYFSYLPIGICLAGMIYRTRGVIIIAAIGVALIAVTAVYEVTNLPVVRSLNDTGQVASLAARHAIGVVFSAMLVIVAMGLFRDLLNRLRAARDEAQTLSEAKSKFLASMSHEVRTPLNAIIGMAEILRTTDLEPEQRRKVETISDAGTALLEMLNDVLDAARIDARQMTILRAPTDMAEFFESFLRLWAPIAEQKGIGFRMEIDPEMPDVLDIDMQRLRQCVNNLLSNAVKFTSSGHVTLIARWDDRPGSPTRLVIEVQDSGIGMSPEAAARIFSPFEQGDDTIGRSYGGSGLGLTITLNLAEMMGGDLTFKSVQGDGSIFTLRITADPAELPEEEDYDEDEGGEDDDEDLSRPGPPRSLGSGFSHPETTQRIRDIISGDDSAPVAPLSGARVVVADDIATNRLVAMGYLRALQVHGIEAESGADAYDIARTQAVDLILLDRHMPDTDGIWALKRLKADPRTTEIPVVIVTAGMSREDEATCVRLGAVEVLTKPFSIPALRGVIERFVPSDGDACVQ